MDFKIWPPYEVFYIHSMLFNTASAVRSFERVSEAFQKISEDESADAVASVDDDDILNNLQNIVVQGAALSRYFWPVRKGHGARAELLRTACGVTDENALKSRDLRNAIEHFDEKLDDYLAHGIVGNIFPQYVGPLPPRDGVPKHIFRAYYTDVVVFELLGKQYEIEPIAREITRLHRRLTFCSNNGGRLRVGGYSK